MDEDDIIVSLCIIIIASAVQRIQRRKRPRKKWVRAWIQRRWKHGAHHALMQELSAEDPEGFRNFQRMDTNDFQELLRKVTPLIQRQDTNMREAISPSERLSITLRYLATGDSYYSLEYLYRIPVSTLSGLIPETCQAIYDSLKEDYMKVIKYSIYWIFMYYANSFSISSLHCLNVTFKAKSMYSHIEIAYPHHLTGYCICWVHFGNVDMNDHNLCNLLVESL